MDVVISVVVGVLTTLARQRSVLLVSGGLVVLSINGGTANNGVSVSISSSSNSSSGSGGGDGDGGGSR